MIATLVNLSDQILNDFDAITGGTVATLGPAYLNAVSGGSRKRPLPYPFKHVVLQASGDPDNLDQVVLPMNQRDWRYKSVYGLPHEPGEEMAVLVQAGTVSIAFASQTGVVDPEDLGDAADTL